MTVARVELGFVPYPHQREAHAARKRFSVVVWHRRAGKTFWALGELFLSACSCTLPRPRYAYVDPFLKQAKAIAWPYLKDFALRLPGTKINESDHVVTLANGATIWLLGADNPPSLRGVYWDGVVLDEYADMRPDTWTLILRPTLIDRRGWAIFIGTPNGPDAFQQVYETASSGADPNWYADLRTVDDTGLIPDDELEALKRDMRPNELAQELYCDFTAAATDTLISLIDASLATKRTVELAEYRFAPRILGVDVARMGDDQTVLAFRQGLHVEPFRVEAKLDTMQVADIVAGEIERWDPDATFIDMGACGAGVFDRLRMLGYKRIHGVDFGGKASQPRYENKRIEMWDSLRDWLKVGSLPPRDHELLTQLAGPKVQHKNDSGRMQLESKDSMKKRGLRSPDKADALALTFAFPVRPRALAEELAQRGASLRPREGRCVSELDAEARQEAC
jgi:hypothetical protein